MRAISMFIFVSIMSVLLLALTGANLVFANVFGEACGLIHPTIFEIEVTMIRSNGTSISSTENRIPPHEPGLYINPVAEDLFTGFDASGEVIGELDTFLSVYDGDGNVIAQNDDFVSVDSAIEGLDVSGVTAPILIEVATYADLFNGQFSLSVRPSDGAPQDPVIFFDQPLLDTETERSISLDTQESSQIITGQRALYRLEGRPDSGVIDIRLSGQETAAIEDGQRLLDELDTYLRVYNANGELIGENDDDLSFNSALYALDISNQPQPILISVGTFDDASRGRYNLIVFEEFGEAVQAQVFDSDIDPPAPDAQIGLGEELRADIAIGQRVIYELTQQPQTGLVTIFLSGQQTEAVTEQETEEEGNTLAPPEFNPNLNTEDEWGACLQYYGYFDNDQFSITQNGIARYITFKNADALLKLISDHFAQAVRTARAEAERVGAAWPGTPSGDARAFVNTANDIGILGPILTSISPITKEYASSCDANIEGNGVQVTSVDLGIGDCIIDGVIALSVAGRIIFYVVLPLIVILLPILVVLGLNTKKDRPWWALLLVLVVIHSTTTSLLFVSLSQVSGLEALREFGTGIFGGIVTGAALGFIGQVMATFAHVDEA